MLHFSSPYFVSQLLLSTEIEMGDRYSTTGRLHSSGARNVCTRKERGGYERLYRSLRAENVCPVRNRFWIPIRCRQNFAFEVCAVAILLRIVTRTKKRRSRYDSTS